MIAQASTTRKAGVAVLTAAVTGILIAGLVSHRGVPGQALTDVQFYPPAAEQCIDEADTTRTVDCAVPHTAQIVRAWNVWEKEVTATGFGDLKQICWQLGSAALQPLGLSRADPFAGAVPPAVWAPPPLTVDTDIVISALDATPRPWVACVVKPRAAVTPDINAPLVRVGPFTGDITTLIPMGNRPANLRSCYESRDRLPVTVNCRSWHRGEILAEKMLPVAPFETSSGTDLQTCGDIAAQLLQIDDPTLAGRLNIDVDARPAAGQINRLPADQAGGTLLRCIAEPAGDKLLTDSIVGLADKPLPTN